MTQTSRVISCLRMVPIFDIANRHTFGYIFGRDLASPKQIARNQSLILTMVMRFIAANEDVCWSKSGTSFCLAKDS